MHTTTDQPTPFVIYIDSVPYVRLSKFHHKKAYKKNVYVTTQLLETMRTHQCYDHFHQTQVKMGKKQIVKDKLT